MVPHFLFSGCSVTKSCPVWLSSCHGTTDYFRAFLIITSTWVKSQDTIKGRIFLIGTSKEKSTNFTGRKKKKKINIICM